MSKWPEDRREEMAQLFDMIHMLSHANAGSGFLNNISECIKLAKQLDKSDISNGRIAFTQFLISAAAGDKNG